MGTLGALLVIIAFILFINVLIRVIKIIRKKNEGVSRKDTAIRAGVAFILFTVGMAVTPVDDNIEAENNDKEKEKTSEEVVVEDKDEEKEAVDEDTYDITSESDLERLVIDILGDTTNTDEKRVEDVVYNEFDDDPYIGLKLNANENVTTKLSKSGILKDTLDVMKSLNDEGYEGKFYVDWRLPLTDKYGETKLGKVLSIRITAEDFAKINFESVDYNRLPDIAESYFEHPDFSK